jgi:MFS family permease
MCTTLLQFILIRGVATGGGEAFYAPAANALLGQKYPQNRAFVLSIHQTGIYAGTVFSGLVAGYVGEVYGWKNSFFLFGGFGILLAFFIFKGYKKNKLANVLIEKQKKIAELKKAGFLFEEFKKSNFSNSDLMKADFSIKDFKDAGLSDQDLKNAGFKIIEFINAGYTEKQLQDLSFNFTEIKRIFLYKK